MEEWNDNNLIKFLGVLFQNELSAREKKDILERDFNIPMTETFESEVDDMCNLSQGVAEEAMQKGLCLLYTSVLDGTTTFSEMMKITYNVDN